MLNINTNLTSLLAQRSLKTSTQLLNQAVQRMTTGFRVNSAKDDPANFAVITQLDSKISSCDITEENTLMSLDLITTASDSLDLIYEKFQRLRYLQDISLNNTYGEDSLAAINVECNSLVDEINNLYLNTQFNGINLFLATTTSADGTAAVLQEVSADESTSFEDLNITSSSFKVYDINGVEIAEYEIEGENTIGDLFATLTTHGIEGSVTGGRISLKTTNGNYIEGALADELGIEVAQEEYIKSTTQTSSSPVTYDSVSTSTTEQEVSITTTTSTTQTVTLYETVTTSNSVTETIEVEKTVGISNASSTTVTYTSIGVESTATADNTLASIGMDGNYSINGVTFDGSTTISELVNNLTSAGISATFSEGVITIEGEIKESITVDESRRVSKVTTFVAGTTYQISTSSDLVALQNMVSSGVATTSVSFEMTNDIDMSGTTFRGIGTSTAAFNGSFDGHGNSINNLSVYATTSYAGLFGYTNGATIKNISLDNCTVEGDDYFGALVGYCKKTNIDNCSASINFNGSEVIDSVGGLAGFVSDSTISNCETSGEMKYLNINKVSALDKTTLRDIGGLIGFLASGVVNNCNSSVDFISAACVVEENIGGFIGGVNSGTVLSCYSTGNISISRDSDESFGNYANDATESVGGLIGSVNVLIMKECYSTGNVEVPDNSSHIGGLIGTCWMVAGSVKMTNCYALGNIVGRSWVGGLVGYVSAYKSSNVMNITNCYTSGDVESNSYSSAGGVVGIILTNSSTLFTVKINNTFALGNVINGGGFIGQISTSGTGSVMPALTGAKNYSNSSNSKTIASGTFAGVTATSKSSILSSSILNTMGFTEANGWDLSGENPTLNFSAGATISTALLIDDTTLNALGLYSSGTNEMKTKVFTYTPTQVVNITDSTKLSEIGINATQYITVQNNGTQTIITLATTSTIGSITAQLTSAGLTSSVSDGKLSISESENSYISGISTDLQSNLNLNSDFTSSRTETTETVITEYTTITTSTTATQTIWETTTTNTTLTHTIYTTTTKTATGATTLGELGSDNTSLNLCQDGNLIRVSISESMTLDEFLTLLGNYDITAEYVNHKVSLEGAGDSYILSTELSKIFKLTSLTKDYANKNVNTKSDYKSYSKNIISEVGNIYAPGSFNLKVGTDDSEVSTVKIQTAFSLSGYNDFRQIGLNGTNCLEQLDKILDELTVRQTELGATQCRLLSVLEELTIRRDNMISSRSTLRDADLSEVTAEYIQQQILQQASSTLLATANQHPGIALQLL